MNNFPSKTFEQIYWLRVEQWVNHLDNGTPIESFDTWITKQNTDKATVKNMAWIRKNARRKAEAILAR